MTTATVETMETEAPRTAVARIGFGLSAANWEDGFRIAKIVSSSSMVPQAYQGNLTDAVVAMQYGAEVGLPPMASLQSIFLAANGKPSLYGDGFLAVVMASPRYIRHVEKYRDATGAVVDGLRAADYDNDDTCAVTQFWRRGNPDPFVAEFSIADAKRAKLWGKAGAWSTNPARMLRWRAREFAGRDGFAAELRGMTIADDEPANAEAPTVLAIQPIPPPIRRSEKTATTTPTPPATPTPKPAPTTPATPQTPSRPKPPTTPTPQPAPTKAPTASTQTDGLVITDSSYVAADPPYWEILARVDQPGAAPVGFAFRTDDESIFKLADSAAGTPQHFAITWRPVQQPAGKDYKVIEEIVAD